MFVINSIKFENIFQLKFWLNLKNLSTFQFSPDNLSIEYKQHFITSNNCMMTHITILDLIHSNLVFG